jgi:hypothetical protein
MTTSRLFVVLALGAGGCDYFFLSENEVREAAPDALAADATPDAAACPNGATPIALRAPTVADAVLIAPAPGNNAQAFGGLPNMYLNHGTSIKSVGIWRFSLAGITVPHGEWLGARVVLEHLPADDDCGAGCGSCQAFEETGMFELYPIRDQWDEQTVSWTARTAAAAWAEPGAAGADRGAFVTRATHVPRQRLELALAADGIAQLVPWISASSVSIVVVPKANPDGTGARMIVPALPPRASCSPPSPPSYLEIDVCPNAI